MVTDRGSAEEQLLKLIEGSSESSAPPGGSSAAAPRPPRWARLALVRRGLAGLQRAGIWLGRFKPPMAGRPRRAGDPMLTRLSLANRALSIALIVLAVSLGLDLLGLQRSRGSPGPAGRGTAGLPGGRSQAKPEDYMKPMSVYIHSASQRNPFLPPGTEVATEAPKPRVAEHRMKELADGLVVVGIDRSGTPRALIEDTKLSRTYFVRVGEQVSGATVKNITSDGVTLDYEGQTVELPY